MNNQHEEFFKLDSIDRKVLFWLMGHSPRTVKSWIVYIVSEYRERKAKEIDPVKLCREVEDI